MALGALSCGDNAIDYSDETGEEAAIKTQMTVCYELSCSHDGYCDASRFLMSNRRCDMRHFLKDAHKTQQKKDEEAQHKGVRDADDEVTAAICCGAKSYISSRCQRGGG